MNLNKKQLIGVMEVMFSSSSSDEDYVEDNEQKKKRKMWMRPYYTKRSETGAHSYIFQTLRELGDDQLFYGYMRMNCSKVEELLTLVGPAIKKQTVIREPINESMRLVITLRYLATGESQSSLALAFKCSPSAVHLIIKETTKAISAALKPVVFPKINEELFKFIGNGFHTKWNFPNCLGAVDGKHITIQKPDNSGSEFFNYKKTFSIVLMAICDHNYRFIMCDIGAAGRQSDGGVFRHSTFGKMFYSNSLPIPKPTDVAEDFKNVPFVFVVDDAFSLTINMLKPYSKSMLTTTERIFNYRLSRARRVIENSFGILSSKWRIFKATINAKVELVESIVQSCVCLHNWLMMDNDISYVTPGLVDFEKDGKLVNGSWRSDSTNFIALEKANKNSSNAAKELRNRFADYFTGSGSVEWQMDKI